MFEGLRLTLSSISYIRQHRLGGIYIYTILIGIAFTILCSFLMRWGANSIYDWVSQSTIADDMPTLHTVISYSAYILSWVLMLLPYVVLGATIILVIMGPTLSIIAQKTIAVETGAKPSSQSLWHNIVRTVVVVAVNSLMQLSILVLLFIIGFFVGPLKIFILPLTLAVNAYFYAMSMGDYAMEWLNMTPSESRRYCHKNMFRYIGLGLPFALLMLIPFVGSFLALLIAPATTVACARNFYQNKDNNNQA
ncbi:MAG: EI24 domain-containing protein [Bacteroidales bacterium]|nr:EI24 domain-containing protein [Bacteroidales bacterium]